MGLEDWIESAYRNRIRIAMCECDTRFWIHNPITLSIRCEKCNRGLTYDVMGKIRTITMLNVIRLNNLMKDGGALNETITGATQ